MRTTPANRAPICLPAIRPVQTGVTTTHKASQEYQTPYEAQRLCFVHIGKCGGTTLLNSFLTAGIRLQDYHLRRPPLREEEWLFLWIRDPIKRYVSAFNFAKSVVAFDTSNLSAEDLTLENSPAPNRIKRRMRDGHAYAKDYEALLGRFDSANALAESLTSPNTGRSADAMALMHHPEEHIFKGIGWYSDNGQMLQYCRRRILMIGSVENMRADFDKLKDALDWPSTDQRNECELKTMRITKSAPQPAMSPLAIQNIRDFYADTDYRAIRTMHRLNLIESERADQYLDA